MTAAQCSEAPSPQEPTPLDDAARIAALRTCGARHFDPVRLHYLELLAQRAQGQRGTVRRLLEAKLALALAEWSSRLNRARSAAAADILGVAASHPQALVPLQALLDAGDLRGLRQALGQLQAPRQATALGALTRYLEQQAPEALPQAAATGLDGRPGSRTELKSVRHFRNTWSRLSAGRQLAQALQRAPHNAGPINSHMLVLRSLALMRDISPAYLNHFISYADTLLCLDQSERTQQATVKAETDGAITKKPRAWRSRS